jgi:hypothetical protein
VRFVRLGSLHEAIGEVRNAGSLDHAGALEPDPRALEVVEQPEAISEEDRYEVDLHPVDQPRLQVLLGDVRASAQGDVLPPAAARAWSRADAMPSVTRVMRIKTVAWNMNRMGRNWEVLREDPDLVGADNLWGGQGRDALVAGFGRDTAGQGGQDIVAGGQGNDICLSGIDHAGRDQIRGGPGHDRGDSDVGDSVTSVEDLVDFLCYGARTPPCSYRRHRGSGGIASRRGVS